MRPDPAAIARVAESIDLSGDPHLAALRHQMGEPFWLARVAVALERAQLLEAVAAFRAEGLGAEAAHRRGVEETGLHATISTARAWRARMARGGLLGLVDRGGRPERTSSRDEAPREGAPSSRGRKALSFVKWAGSKRVVMDALLRHLRVPHRTYYEPMVGSGTVFLTLAPERAVLGDADFDLMTCWEMIRDRVDELVEALRGLRNEREEFYRVRGQDPDLLGPVGRAARFIYLNKTCFNGLYRVNAAGQFNVPYGRIPHANVCDEPLLRRVSERLCGVRLSTADYRQTLVRAGEGDLVYLDPPYPPLPGRPVQNLYGAAGFDAEAHAELAETFRDLDRRGCTVVLSNADRPFVRDLYDGYPIEAHPVRRSVHFSPAARAGGDTELIVTTRRRR